MSARRPNTLFLFSDEHDPRHMGISGSAHVKTPNLDRLARGGARFVNAYTNEERFFDGDPGRRKLAIAAYYGLCTFLDEKIGQVLGTLDETGLGEETVVIYSSDHGDNVGARGLWGKSNLYRESSSVPLILKGPGIPPGDVNFTPVSLTDLHATFLEIAGVEDLSDGFQRRTESLLRMLGSFQQSRTVLSQYHAIGAPTGAFMVADARWKYHHYVGYPPELFDLRFDPEETTNRAGDPACADIVSTLHRALIQHLGGCAPEDIDRCAKDDQNALVERTGGRDVALRTGPEGATPAPGEKSAP